MGDLHQTWQWDFVESVMLLSWKDKTLFVNSERLWGRSAIMCCLKTWFRSNKLKHNLQMLHPVTYHTHFPQRRHLTFKDLNSSLVSAAFWSKHKKSRLWEREISLEWIYWSGCCNIKIKFNQKNIILQSADFLSFPPFLLLLQKKNCVFLRHFSISRGSLSTVDIHFVFNSRHQQKVSCQVGGGLQDSGLLHDITGECTYPHQKSNFMQMIYTSAIARLSHSFFIPFAII